MKVGQRAFFSFCEGRELDQRAKSLGTFGLGISVDRNHHVVVEVFGLNWKSLPELSALFSRKALPLLELSKESSTWDSSGFSDSFFLDLSRMLLEITLVNMVFFPQ